MKFKILIISLIIFQAISANAQKYSLDDCIRIAENQNYDLKASESNLKSSKANLNSAAGQYLPSVNANANYNQYLPIINDNKFKSFSLSTSASYTIFDGFSRSNNYDAAQNSLTASENKIDFDKSQLKLNVIREFVNVIRNKQIANLRKENFELSKKDLERVKAQNEAGLIPINLVYSQEAEMGNREFEMVSADNNFTISKFNLLNAMGIAPNENIDFDEASLPNEISINQLSAFKSEYANLDNAIAKAKKERKDYAALNNQLSALENNINSSKSGYYPSLSASAGMSWSSSEFSNFRENISTSIGLNLRVPIFDQYATDSRVEIAEINAEQQIFTIKSLENNIISQIRSSYLNNQANEKQLEITQKALFASERNFESAKESYEIGASNVLEYLTANTQYITAKINRINSIYSYVLSQKELQFSVGVLK